MVEPVAKAGVAIRTGAESGLVVIDIDSDHGGERSLADLLDRHGALPDGRTIHTGGGGAHLYFQHPGYPIPNSAGRLGTGVDIRGDGGYVVAPPSRHRSKRSYAVIAHDGIIPELPTWVMRALAPEPLRQPLVAARSPRNASAWARAAVDGELGRLREAGEGTRNDTLNRVAYRLGQIIGTGSLSEHDIAPLLIEQGIAIGLREREVETTVRSGLRAGEGEPRGPAKTPEVPSFAGSDPALGAPPEIL